MKWQNPNYIRRQTRSEYLGKKLSFLDNKPCTYTRMYIQKIQHKKLDLEIMTVTHDTRTYKKKYYGRVAETKSSTFKSNGPCIARGQWCSRISYVQLQQTYEDWTSDQEIICFCAAVCRNCHTVFFNEYLCNYFTTTVEMLSKNEQSACLIIKNILFW